MRWTNDDGTSALLKRWLFVGSCPLAVVSRVYVSVHRHRGQRGGDWEMATIYSGYGADLSVDAAVLTVMPKGIGRAGSVGAQQIPLAEIVGVEFKEASRLTNGHVCVLTKDHPQFGGTNDTRLVRFTHKQRESFSQLKTWLDHVVKVNGGDEARASALAEVDQREADAARAQRAEENEAASRKAYDKQNVAVQKAEATAQKNAERKEAAARKEQDRADRMRQAAEKAEQKQAAKAEALAHLRPDVRDATLAMTSKFGARRELRHVEEYLWDDERVLRMAAGYMHGGQGLLVLTDRRIFFIYHGWVSKKNEDFLLTNVTSISVSKGLGTAKVAVLAAGARDVVERVTTADASALVDEARRRIGPGAQTTPVVVSAGMHQQVPAIPQPATEDVLSKIKQLGELHKAGILTDEEFRDKKATLLERL